MSKFLDKVHEHRRKSSNFTITNKQFIGILGAFAGISLVVALYCLYIGKANWSVFFFASFTIWTIALITMIWSIAYWRKYYKENAGKRRTDIPEWLLTVENGEFPINDIHFIRTNTELHTNYSKPDDYKCSY